VTRTARFAVALPVVCASACATVDVYINERSLGSSDTADALSRTAACAAAWGYTYGELSPELKVVIKRELNQYPYASEEAFRSLAEEKYENMRRDRGAEIESGLGICYALMNVDSFASGE